MQQQKQDSVNKVSAKDIELYKEAKLSQAEIECLRTPLKSLDAQGRQLAFAAKDKVNSTIWQRNALKRAEEGAKASDEKWENKKFFVRTDSQKL